MKTILIKTLNLLKFPAYREFPMLTREQLLYRSVDTVVYSACPNLFGGTYETKGHTESVAPGPHYKCRRFWLWSKRKGWRWGTKFVGTLVADLDTETAEWDSLAKVSQRWRICSSTLPFARWDGKSLSIDLDAWESFVSKPSVAPNFELSFGRDPLPECPSEKKPSAVEKLFPR